MSSRADHPADVSAPPFCEARADLLEPSCPEWPADLRTDCAACAALCCVVPPFDAVQGFGYDKPPCTPCQHLQADHRCGIHAQRIERGYVGCTVFDCHGAGNWVMQTYATATSEQRHAAYARAQPLHALWLLLVLAQPRCPDAGLRAQLHAQAERVAAAREGSEPVQALHDATHALLRRLAPFVSRP